MTPGFLPPQQSNGLPPEEGIPIDALAPAMETQTEDQKENAEPHEARVALCKRWQGKIQNAKKRHEKAFKRMRKDLDFLAGKQWSQNEDDDRYMANIIQRHIAQRVAALYAKNPTIIAKRRDTLDFAKWEGTLAEAQGAAQQIQQGMAMGMQIMPQAMEMAQDIAQGFQKRKLLDRVAKTMELVAKYTLDEQLPPFKMQMKRLVRRTCAASVGFMKIGLQRFMKKRPEDLEKITDITQRLVEIQRLSEQLSEKDEYQLSMLSAEAEQLRLEMLSLEETPDIVAKEGVAVDFPRATSIIIDPRCTDLRSFLGAKFVAHEFIMSTDDVREIYDVDLKKGHFTAYNDPDQSRIKIETGDKEVDGYKPCDQVCVWEIYSKTDGLVYVCAEGHKDFLQEPKQPDVKLERFWPFFVLCFNEMESETELYPPSDISLLRPMQLEYNRLREGLREHRFSNRPLTAIPDGVLDPEDKMKLEARPANGVITLKGLQPGQRIGDILQPVEGPVINPQLYDTSAIFDDVMRVVGAQEANLGGTSSATATESSIAESSRMSALASNVDDLDDFMNEFARSLGQVLLTEISAETVQKIAGPGSVWPELTAQDIANELILEVQGGSSGRPNKAAELANMEKIVPLLIQIPGVSPDFLAKELIKRMDDKIDLTDALQSGLQSIVSMNGQKQVGTGDPATDPNMQGGQGGDNAPAAPEAPQDNQLPAPQQDPNVVTYDNGGNRLS
jgi:hypothetical protein